MGEVKQNAPEAADLGDALPGPAFAEAGPERCIGDGNIIAQKGGDCNG